MSVTSAKRLNLKGLVVQGAPTWGVVDLVMKEEEAVVALIVAASEEGEVTGEALEVAEGEIVEDLDQGKWIPGEITDKTEGTDHISWDRHEISTVFSYVLFCMSGCVLWILSEYVAFVYTLYYLRCAPVNFNSICKFLTH